MNRLRFKTPKKIKRLHVTSRTIKYQLLRRQNSVNGQAPIIAPVFQEEDLSLTSSKSHDKGSNVDSCYTQKKQRLYESWTKIRNNITQARLEEFSPATLTCCRCSTDTVNIVKCISCGPLTYYCQQCCEEVHSHMLFHLPEIWMGSLYLPLQMKTKLHRKDGHACGDMYLTDITVVDIKGMQRPATIEFCKCEPPAVTLLRYNLWPGSPTEPKMAFDLSLMEYLACLQLECHIPTKTFCESLKHFQMYSISSSLYSRKDIYRVLVGDCLLEYMYHRSTLSTRNNIIPSTTGLDCAICQTNPAVVSMDANFGLVHKVSSGDGHQTRHQNLFFKHKEKFKDFIEDYAVDKTKEDLDCSNFQAGNLVRSKIKTNKLDVTGLFGCLCKHDIPLTFLDMSHGERLGYSVFLLEEFICQRTTDEKIILMYDIACILHKHLKKNSKSSVLEKCTFAVPVFHSFAHNLSCQIDYGQRFVEGTGLTDGEGIERFWSYLRPFKKITKEMNLNNRNDLLSEAMLHSIQKIQTNLGIRLEEKFCKAEKLVEESDQKIIEILSTEYTNADFEETNRKPDAWLQDLKHSCQLQSHKDNNLTPDELYAETLENLSLKRTQLSTARDASVRSTLTKEQDRLVKESLIRKSKSSFKKRCLDITSETGLMVLRNAKKKRKLKTLKSLHQLAIERQYLSTLMKKYADGQNIGIRISKQFTRNSTKIKKHLETLNSKFDEHLDFNVVSNPLSQIYKENVSISTNQYKAVEAFLLKSHAEDEKFNILKDANKLFLNFQLQSNSISNSIHTLNQFTCRPSKGKSHYLYFHHYILEKRWKSSLIFNRISPVEIPLTVHEMLNILEGTDIDNDSKNSYSEVNEQSEILDTHDDDEDDDDGEDDEDDDDDDDDGDDDDDDDDGDDDDDFNDKDYI